MKEVKQEGEKKVSQMKQQLREEQTRSKQREQEIDQLKRYYSDTDSIGLILHGAHVRAWLLTLAYFKSNWRHTVVFVIPHDYAKGIFCPSSVVRGY